MLQIILNHLFGQLTRGCTKVTSCPKVSSPISLFQIGKAFKQLHRTSSFDSPHDFAGRKIRRHRDKNMHMILTDNSFVNLYFKGFTGLSNQFTNFQSNVSFQHFLTILRHEHKMVLDFVNRMTSIAIFHEHSFFSSFWLIITQSVIDKSNRLKAVVLTLKTD